MKTCNYLQNSAMSTRPGARQGRPWQHILMLMMLTMVLSISSGQVIVHLRLPPAGQFTPEDFTAAVSFSNPTGVTLAASLFATLEEESAGLIFSGKSSVFAIEPGYSIPHYTVYEPMELLYSQPFYERYVVQHNGLPPGSYTLCVKVMDAGVLEEIGQTCVPVEIHQPSPPIPVYPEQNGLVFNPQPVFIWLPPSPLPPVDIVYRFMLSEWLEGQSPREAILSNPPLTALGELEGNTLSLPAGTSPLIEGQMYVWQIQAVTAEGIPVGMDEGFSEPSTFLFGTPGIRHIMPIQPLANCTGSVTEGITSYDMNVQWQVTGDFIDFQIIVSANPCGQYPPGPPPPTPTPVPTPSPTPTPTPTPTTTPTPTLTPTPSTTTTQGGTDTASGKSTSGGIIAESGSTGQNDTTSGAQKTDSIGMDTAWPDEGETGLPALPPGWEWGLEGVRWTGKCLPAPPDLPPGWGWGPTRPVWIGTGEPPVPRKVIGWSQKTQAIQTKDPNPQSNLWVQAPGGLKTLQYQAIVPLGEYLVSGQAFIYQIYGTFLTQDGNVQGYLSTPQCLRFNHVAGTNTGSDLQPTPVSCDPCLVKLELDTTPAMNGGLHPWKDSFQIIRDEQVVLQAIGADYDMIKWRCVPKPNCNETGSQRGEITSSRVRFHWVIQEGEGDFVEIGCLNPEKEMAGERVIFLPPYVAPDSTKITVMKLHIIDDNPTQPQDATIIRNIEIKCSRMKSDPEYYTIQIISDSFEMGLLQQISGNTQGTCKARGPAWSMDDDLKPAPGIILPQVSDNNKLVFNEMTRLFASDFRDKDRLKVWCEAVSCPTNDTTNLYEDDVEYIWSIVSGKGEFVTGNTGRYVIFKASDIEGAVSIEVYTRNRNSMKIADKPSERGKLTLLVYKPGVRMDQTITEWLPGYEKVLNKRSYLVYEEKGSWKEGLAHQCRIHRVQLLKVSNEPGICLNYPQESDFDPNAFSDTCPDLSFRRSDQWELFDSVYCERYLYYYTDTVWCMRGNSKRPVKEFNISVHCYDYGAYGFIRSSANPEMKDQGLYVSVPWQRNEYTHPVMGKVLKKVYEDNRVSVPRDIDENQIADWGWTTKSYDLSGTRLRIMDRYDPGADQDNLPQNPHQGDGISNYEEYRGFNARDVHYRLDPERKNLLIWDPDDFGLGLFRNSGISALLVNNTEMDTSRTINYNRGTHSLNYDQKGVRLLEKDLSDSGWAGWADSIGMKVAYHTYIDPTVRNDRAFMNYVIPHELSHSLGALHHGEGYIFGLLPRDSFITIDNKKGKNDTAAWAIFRIACSHGVSSGDVVCWMRYPNYIPYCTAPNQPNNYDCATTIHSVRISNWKIESTSLKRYGTKITNHTQGSGVNSSSRCGGDAAPNRGRCLDQLKITTEP